MNSSFLGNIYCRYTTSPEVMKRPLHYYERIGHRKGQDRSTETPFCPTCGSVRSRRWCGDWGKVKSPVHRRALHVNLISLVVCYSELYPPSSLILSSVNRPETFCYFHCSSFRNHTTQAYVVLSHQLVEDISLSVWKRLLFKPFSNPRLRLQPTGLSKTRPTLALETCQYWLFSFFFPQLLR